MIRYPVACHTKYIKTVGWLALLLLITGLNYSCSSREVLPDTSSINFDADKVLVLQFRNMTRIYGEDKSVRSPLTGTYFITGKVLEGSEEVLTRKLVSQLKERSDFMLLPPSQAKGELSQVLSKNIKGLSEKNLIVEIGRNLGADAVVTGNIYRFRERIGTQHSVESPASVEFEIYLVSTKDGMLLWSNHYVETQRALSEDLFQLNTFIKRKGRWITAEEMAIAGLESLLRTFPEL